MFDRLGCGQKQRICKTIFFLYICYVRPSKKLSALSNFFQKVISFWGFYQNHGDLTGKLSLGLVQRNSAPVHACGQRGSGDQGLVANASLVTKAWWPAGVWWPRPGASGSLVTKAWWPAGIRVVVRKQNWEAHWIPIHGQIKEIVARVNEVRTNREGDTDREVGDGFCVCHRFRQACMGHCYVPWDGRYHFSFESCPGAQRQGRKRDDCWDNAKTTFIEKR